MGRAQELLERDGFIVFGSPHQHSTGDVITADGPSCIGGAQVVVIGTLTKQEAFSYADRNKMKLAKRKHYYRVIAE